MTCLAPHSSSPSSESCALVVVAFRTCSFSPTPHQCNSVHTCDMSHQRKSACPGPAWQHTSLLMSTPIASLACHQPYLRPLFNRFNSSRGTQDLFARKADLTAAQCHFVSAEGRREFVSEQFDSTPEILTFFREPISRTVSQWNHDKQCVMGPPLALTVEYYCTIPCLHTVTLQVRTLFAQGDVILPVLLCCVPFFRALE